MRQAYAHDAVISMAPGGDIRAPGGAITVALCGSLEHEPPCPLAAHHTRADRATPAESGTPDEQPGTPDQRPGTPDEQHSIDVRLRILFAAEPDDSAAARLGIDRALGAESFAGPDGVITEWRLLDSGPAEITADEQDHAHRLTT